MARLFRGFPRECNCAFLSISYLNAYNYNHARQLLLPSSDMFLPLSAIFAYHALPETILVVRKEGPSSLGRQERIPSPSRKNKKRPSVTRDYHYNEILFIDQFILAVVVANETTPPLRSYREYMGHRVRCLTWHKWAEELNTTIQLERHVFRTPG